MKKDVHHFLRKDWRMDSDERQYLKDYFSDRKSIPCFNSELDYPDKVNSKSWGREKPLYWSSYKRVLDQLDKDQWVLDVGCGINPLKFFHKKTYGIDITDVGSDEQVAIEDFESPRKFDVAICWGSINFGYYQLIDKQIEKLASVMNEKKSVIYWRLNPGMADHVDERCQNINFFPWSSELMFEFANEHNYTITELLPDENRIYCKWEKGTNHMCNSGIFIKQGEK